MAMTRRGFWPLNGMPITRARQPYVSCEHEAAFFDAAVVAPKRRRWVHRLVRRHETFASLVRCLCGAAQRATARRMDPPGTQSEASMAASPVLSAGPHPTLPGEPTCCDAPTHP